MPGKGEAISLVLDVILDVMTSHNGASKKTADLIWNLKISVSVSSCLKPVMKKHDRTRKFPVQFRESSGKLKVISATKWAYSPA